MAKEPEYSLNQIETIDREWTDEFAKKTGWQDFDLQDPVDDLTRFFSELSGLKVLDSGCGWGRYIWRFRDQNLFYYGLDHSEEMLRVARMNNAHTPFVRSSFREIPFASEYFDGVWSCCALAGFPKKYLLEILHEHLRVLRRGGIVMFIMPSLPDNDEQMYTKDNGKPSIYQAHYFLSEFMEYVTAAGFKIISSGQRWNDGAFSILATRPL